MPLHHIQVAYKALWKMIRIENEIITRSFYEWSITAVEYGNKRSWIKSLKI
jgi:hypothetical protein